MKNKNMINILKSTLYAIAAVVQIALVIIVIAINHLTTKKAGVMKHVYSRRIQYEQAIFSNGNLIKYSFLSIALGMLFIILLINAITKKKSMFFRIQIVLGIITSFLVTIVINSSLFINMLAYPYFIIAFGLVLLIQAMIVIVSQYNYR